MGKKAYVERLGFRASPAEIDFWQGQATAAGKSLSEWIRWKCNHGLETGAEIELLMKIHAALERNNTLLINFLVTQGIEVAP